jgi:predicted neuraminidase
MLAVAAVSLAGCALELGFPPAADVQFSFNTEGPGQVIAAGQPAFVEGAVFDTISGRSGHHAATLTAFPDGELLAAWYSYAGPGELDGSAIYTARLPAGAGSWEALVLQLDQPHGLGNPVLYSEGDEVWLFHAVAPGGWSSAHIEVQRSHDRGQSWSRTAAIGGPIGSNVRYPPLRTADGDLLLPGYDDLLQRSLFFVSGDGESWTLRSAVWSDSPHQNVQPSLVRLDSGRLLATMRNVGKDWLWVTASDDGGRSWARPRNSGFANPGSAAQLLRLRSGNLLLVFNDSPSERRPLSIALSPDEGRSWTLPKAVADGDSTYSYPAAIQTPDGLIHVLYSRGRESIRHTVLNEPWIASP